MAGGDVIEQAGVVVRSGRGSSGLVVSLEGRLDATSVPDARLVMHRHIDAADGVVRMDLGDCLIGDSTALGMIVEILARAHRRGIHLEVIHPDERTRRLLRRIRLGRLLQILECEHTRPALHVGALA